MLNKKIKVIIVDDSALIRALLSEVLSEDPRFDVVAAAQDAYEARELIKKHNPDVITLDIEMPKMNGIVFLENLMRLRPLPVVMISTLTQEGAPATLRALEIGAIDFIAKPKTGNATELGKYGELICEKVFTASKARVRDLSEARSSDEVSKEVEKYKSLSGSKKLDSRLICAIGASTGGTEAIKEVVTVLPASAPPIVIAQHIPEMFSASFAKRMNSQSQVQVYEAEHNQPIVSGAVYIAPGHSHLEIAKNAGSGYVCKLNRSEPVNRHMPSVEVLYDSVRKTAGQFCFGVLLTGMGADGAEALLRMKQAGIYTVAQNEASSVVWGMPGAAVKMGAADDVLDIKQIAGAIMERAYN